MLAKRRGIGDGIGVQANGVCSVFLRGIGEQRMDYYNGKPARG